MHDRTAPTICGKIAKLGAQPFGFIHDAAGKQYLFYFDQVTGIESDGQYARLVQGAVTSMQEAKYDVTLRVGDQVRFHAQNHAKGKRNPTPLFARRGHMYAWDGGITHRGTQNVSRGARPIFMFSLQFSKRLPTPVDQLSLHSDLKKRLV